MVDRRFIDLVMWRDLRNSAVVFASGLVLLASVSCFSLISVVSYVGLSGLTVAVAIRLYARVTGATSKADSPLAFFLADSNNSYEAIISEEQTRIWIDRLLPIVNCCISGALRAFLLADVVESVKCAIILYLLSYIGDWFNLLTLIFIAFIGMFTVPRLYEQYKSHIDVLLVKFQSHFGQLFSIVQAKLTGLRKKTQ